MVLPGCPSQVELADNNTCPLNLRPVPASSHFNSPAAPSTSKALQVITAGTLPEDHTHKFDHSTWQLPRTKECPRQLLAADDSSASTSGARAGALLTMMRRPGGLMQVNPRTHRRACCCQPQEGPTGPLGCPDCTLCTEELKEHRTQAVFQEIGCGRPGGTHRGVTAGRSCGRSDEKKLCHSEIVFLPILAP